MNLGMLVECTFLLVLLHFTMAHCGWTLLSQFGESSFLVDKKVLRARVGLGLKTCGIGREPMHELEWGRANGRLVGRVVGKFHGRQEFFPIQSVIMQVWTEVVLDTSIEVLNLGIALRMSRSCLGVLDVQDRKELG